jgi:hypothetical protein
MDWVGCDRLGSDKSLRGLAVVGESKEVKHIGMLFTEYRAPGIICCGGKLSTDSGLRCRENSFARSLTD